MLAGTITFADNDFQDADWMAVEVLDLTPNDSFVFSGNRLSAGGNPGAYRRVVNELNTLASSPIRAGHFRSGAVFDPGEDGSFLSLDVSFDGISQPGNLAGAMGYGIVLEQGGNFFTVGFGQVLDGAGWANFGATGLVEGSFSAVDAGSLDLSDAGGLVSIGVLVANGTFGLPSTNVGGFDNWSVNVNTVSEPAQLALLGLGVAGLSVARRKWGRAGANQR
ncbi:MAG: PEP-CTERM sorting domain-containing protein [Alphaproteobacteria bacterium]